MPERRYDNDSTQPSYDRAGGDSTIGWPHLTGHRNSVNLVQHQFRPGDMIDGRYQVMGVLGQGGFGCVYKVFQVLLRKEFALKTLNPVQLNETAILRLRKEAQTASRLEHANLVHAVDFGMLDHVQPFLVMDFVEGPTLAEYLKERCQLSVDTALEIFIPIAQAVAYAHKQGVVHRDLKPSNVILSTDRANHTVLIPKIVDFGIAKIRESDDSRAMALTATGDIFGTPLYMSPEQCAGTGVDARSDIYSMGCMLFEALTGAPPFNGRNALEIMMQHGAANLPSLKEASLGETFSPELERIVSSMLAKLPEERFSNAQTIADDLFWLKHGELDRLSTPSINDPTVTKKKAKREHARTLIALTIAGTTVGAMLGFGAALYSRPEQKPTEVSHLTEIPAQSVLSGDMDEAYLSKEGEGGGRIFKFPKVQTNGNEGDLEGGWGSFHWWMAGGKVESKKITVDGKSVDIPATAKRLIFKSGYCMGQFPYTFSRYRHDDLFGIIIDSNLCEFDHNTTVATVAESLIQQHDLKVLSLRTLTLTPKAFKSLGYISDLQWLDLKDVWLQDSAKGIEAPKASGAEIVDFPYLPNLKVLCLDGIKDVTPVLTHLNPQNLRGLSLAADELKDDSLALLDKFHELQVLNLRGNSIDGEKLVSLISKLKKLKKLAIDVDVLNKTNPETLKSLKGLTLMFASDKAMKKEQKELKPEQREALKGCEVISDPGKTRGGRSKWPDQEWLDSLRVDPTLYGI